MLFVDCYNYFCRESAYDLDLCLNDKSVLCKSLNYFCYSSSEIERSNDFFFSLYSSSFNLNISLLYSNIYFYYLSTILLLLTCDVLEFYVFLLANLSMFVAGVLIRGD